MKHRKNSKDYDIIFSNMIIQKSENQDIEFKQSWQNEYLKWICAFANTKGGILYIGVNDKGTVTGVQDFHKLSETIPLKITQSMAFCVMFLLLMILTII